MAIKVKVIKCPLDARHCIFIVRQAIPAAYFTGMETEASESLGTCPRSQSQHS